ncbi:hypothetical protein FNI40_26275 [Salmonella enterica subsp. diarizonae]|nr:hypothetical protein [Salmonella enterica subsp. diarizonae]
MCGLLISAVLNPPSFNEWQAMNSITDIMVVAAGFIIREVSLISFMVAVFILSAFVIMDIKNILKILRRS